MKMDSKGKVLVTGGAGYIGTHTIVQLIGSGYDVVVVDDLSNSHESVLDDVARITGKRPTAMFFDLCDAAQTDELFATHRPSAVIHFAAKKLVGESVLNPLLYYKTNILSLINVIESAIRFDCMKLVFSSSCSVYGQPEENPVSELTPLQKAESPYGNTKRICEEILADTVKAAKLQVASLRYFNPVGAHESALIGEYPLGVPSNLMPVITQTAIGKRDSFSVFGSDYDTPDGTCIRDYIHVMDLADAHVAALRYLENSKRDGFVSTFNIGTGNGISVKQMINAFERVNQVSLNYQLSGRRAGDVVQVWADNTKALKELGWAPTRGLDDMVRSAWKWECHLKEIQIKEEHS